MGGGWVVAKAQPGRSSGAHAVNLRRFSIVALPQLIHVSQTGGQPTPPSSKDLMKGAQSP